MTVAAALYRRNRGTRYQVVVDLAYGPRLLVGYTMRRSRHGLMGLARSHDPATWAAIGLTTRTVVRSVGAGRDPAIEFVNVGTLRFSGATMHDVWAGAPEPPLMGLNLED